MIRKQPWVIRIRVCIPNDIVFRLNVVSYDTVTFAETRSGCATWKKIPKNFPFFVDQSWNRVRFCMTLQQTPNLPGFLGSGLCDPSDIAGEPFYIQEFCFVTVTYQLIWSYSQKPLTFSSLTASNTYTIYFFTLYSLYV